MLQATLLALPLVLGLAQQCFPDAVPEHQRQNLLIEGKEVVLGIAESSWVSAAVVEDIYSILVTERLGFNAVKLMVNETTDDTEGNLFTLMGCANASNYLAIYTATGEYTPECNIASAPTHVFLEAWAPFTTWAVPWMKSAFPQYFPVDLGSIGYSGAEGLWIPRALRDEAVRAEGLPLEFYMSYDAAWHNVSRYFLRLDEFPVDLLSACTSWVSHSSGYLSNYAAVTGDVDGVVDEGDGLYSERCFFGHWWLSPACRANAALCVPAITVNPGSWIGPAMQLATFYNMPIALAVSGDVTGWSMWTELGQLGGALFYSWFPDPTFANLDSLLLQFPPYDASGWARNEFRTGGDVQTLRKYAGAGLQGAAPAAFNLVDGLSITNLQIAELMKMLAASEEPNYTRATACQWLLQNPSIWQPWLPNATNCFVGEGWVDGNSDFLNTQGAVACKRCAPGRFSLRSGRGVVCEVYSGGHFSNAFGATECTPCSPGFFSTSPANFTQVPFKHRVGPASCSPCPLGSFQPNSSSESCILCDSVLPGSMTGFEGAVSESACVCPGGTYLLRNDGRPHCQRCGQGLVCPGATEPQQAAGFFARSALFTDGGALSSPPAVVRCLSAEHCPANLPLGTCPPKLEGLACDGCAGNFRFFRGECVPCANSPGVSAGIALLILAAATAAVSFVGTGSNEAAYSVDRQTFFAAVDFCLRAAQILAAFSQLEFVLVEPLVTLRTAVTAVASFFSASCLIGNNGPLLSYAVAMLVIPIAGLMLLVQLFLLKRCGRGVSGTAMINTVGSAVVSWNLAMALVALQPWGCQLNPDGSSTVTLIRSVTCWTTREHAGMLGMSVAGLLFYMAMPAALVGWATHMYPIMVVQQGGVEFVQRFYFLFGSLKPEHHMFALLLLAGNMALVLVPTVLQVAPGLVPVCMLGVLSMLSMEAQRRTPWRAPFVNYLFVYGLFLIQGMILALVSAAHQEIATRDLQIFTIACLGLALSILLCKIGFIIFKAFRREKKFKVFLCHHKRDGGALARWLKMELQDRLSGNIFLDSDNLGRLDELFSVVSTDTQNLLVILTKETLDRVWCAAEIACATKAKVNIVQVVCDDFAPITDNYISETGNRWTHREQSNLASSSISISQIKDGYEHLRRVPSVRLSDTADLSATVDSIVNHCTGIRKARRPNFSVTSMKVKRQILLIGDTRGVDQAKAIRMVLQRVMQKTMQVSVRAFEGEELADADSTISFVFVLTRQVLEDPVFLNMLLATEPHSSLWLPIIADTDFSVPNDAYYKDLAAGKLIAEQSVGAPLRAVSAAIRRLFQILALRFSANASEQTIQTEVDQIADRIGFISSTAKLQSHSEFELGLENYENESADGDGEEATKKDPNTSTGRRSVRKSIRSIEGAHRDLLPI